MADSKYQNGKIYRLVFTDGHYYIGSTTNKLNYRFNNHKQSAKTENSPLYTHMNRVGCKNVQIELIEHYPCLSKNALTQQEDFYICELKDDPMCLNIIRANVSKEEHVKHMKEYYEEHKEEILEQHKNYIENNKEKVDTYQAEYRQKNTKKRREYTKKYAEEHSEWKKNYDKQYYETHKEEIIERTNEYVEANKEKIKEYKRQWAEKKKEETAEETHLAREEKKAIKQKQQQEKKEKDEEILSCECGGTYQLYRKSRHEKSKRHTNFVEQSTLL